MRKMEKKIIDLIESLDRIMGSWENLTLRRSLLIFFTVTLFGQTIITTILWIFGKDISNGWLGMLTVEHSTWVIMVSYYFKIRGKIDGQSIRNDFEKITKGEEEGEECGE